jgi:hypothetical protein
VRDINDSLSGTLAGYYVTSFEYDLLDRTTRICYPESSAGKRLTVKILILIVVFSKLSPQKNWSQHEQLPHIEYGYRRKNYRALLWFDFAHHK